MRGKVLIPLLLGGKTYMPGHAVECDSATMARLVSRGIVEAEQHGAASMTRAELADLARSRGIEVTAKETKAAIIRKLGG